MNASKQSAVTRELRDWRVWAIAAGCVVVLGHAALQRIGWWTLLAVLPVAALAFAGLAIWLLRRPAAGAGFPAEATQALAAHLPPGTRPPRVLQARQTGEVWEGEWRLPFRSAGPALLKKASGGCRSAPQDPHYLRRRETSSTSSAPPCSSASTATTCA